MAIAEKRGDWYWIDFRFGGQRFRQTLKTKDESVASNVVGGVERTLMLLDQQASQIPEGADVVSFILSGGRTVKMLEAKEAVKVGVTLEQLKEKYVETLAIGAIEENSLYTVQMHLRHFIKTLGARFVMQKLTMNDLQEHVNTRAKAKGIKGRKLSPVTLRKEIASLRACWNWGVQAALVSGNLPNKGLKFPKLTEKHPFQTWDEIQRRIASGVSPAEEADLWDSLFLRVQEIAELLEFVRVNRPLGNDNNAAFSTSRKCWPGGRRVVPCIRTSATSASQRDRCSF